MNSLPTLNLPTGKIGFASMIRGSDEEPRDAFRVELPDRPTMFGEWRAKFADNGNDFNVEIVGFGYLRKPFGEHVSASQEKVFGTGARPGREAHSCPLCG